MKKRIAVVILIAALPLALSAATLIVPAAGTGAGANGSQWQTELMLHSTSRLPISATLIFHDNNGPGEPVTVELAPRATVCLDDVVRAKFNREGGTGAIEIVVDDVFANKLAATSRTFNKSSDGQFGQDIPALNINSAAKEGISLVLNGPSEPAASRFNVGLFAVTDTTVRWELIRADGSLAAALETTYAAGTQTQYNRAVESLFSLGPQDDDVIVAAVIKGAAFAYGSVINEGSGDPTFVPGFETRPDIHALFKGVDYDFNSVVEIGDTDRDGVLDQPLDIFVGQTNVFQIVVENQDVTFEQIPTDAPPVTISADGQVSFGAVPVGLTAATLKFRVNTGADSDVITIPIRYR